MIRIITVSGIMTDSQQILLHSTYNICANSETIISSQRQTSLSSGAFAQLSVHTEQLGSH